MTEQRDSNQHYFIFHGRGEMKIHMKRSPILAGFPGRWRSFFYYLDDTANSGQLAFHIVVKHIEEKYSTAIDNVL